MYIIMYNEFMKTYNISSARKNFSSILKDASRLKETIVITDRNKPIAVIMDFEKAKKDKITLGNDDKNVNIFYESTKDWLEISKNKFKNRKIENISENIDKYLYGK